MSGFNIKLCLTLVLTFVFGLHSGRLLAFFDKEPLNPVVVGFSMLLCLVIVGALIRSLLSNSASQYAASAAVMSGQKPDDEKPPLQVDPKCPSCTKPAVGMKNIKQMFDAKGTLTCQSCNSKLVVEERGAGQGVLVPIVTMSIPGKLDGDSHAAH